MSALNYIVKIVELYLGMPGKNKAEDHKMKTFNRLLKAIIHFSFPLHHFGKESKERQFFWHHVSWV